MDSVLEVWNLATEPAFMCYGSLIIGAAVFLIIRFCPQYGQANVMVYSGNECKSTWNNSIGYICVTSDNPVELLKQSSPVILPLRRSKHTDKDGFESEDIPLRRQESLGSP
ncbi:BnaCnng07750D [Brassica napus]|nr:unnamed protein product [Brassica napus]CDY36673.1 BnaCnng07750D [Brassica napus]